MDITKRDLQPVVSGVCHDFRLLVSKNNLEFIVETPESSCQAAFDGEKIERVLVNLIGNAIKFTPPGGRIRVTLTEEASEVRVCVEDSGRGIPEERIPELFGEFFQLGPDDSSKGSGLGLSICKKIIDSHHGRIWVESAAGLGSRFTFTLPKSL